MTETEIKKAWEYCSTGGKCGKCPLFEIPGCNLILSKATIDLINRKEAEIDRLTKVEKSHQELNGELRQEVERLNFENLQMLASIKGLEERARAEAIKEFAERVKETMGKYCGEITEDDLYQIAKEMERE